MRPFLRFHTIAVIIPQATAAERPLRSRLSGSADMHRYFFDIECGRSSRDDTGTMLPNQYRARFEAVRLLGQELSDRSASFWDDPELKVTVRDEADLILMRITVFGTLAPASG